MVEGVVLTAQTKSKTTSISMSVIVLLLLAEGRKKGSETIEKFIELLTRYIYVSHLCTYGVNSNITINVLSISCWLCFIRLKINHRLGELVN